MKINARQSSIDCFNGRVQSMKSGQHALILSVMQTGRDYTGRELAELTGLTPNIISARLFELREDLNQVARDDGAKRMCTVSGVSVTVHRRVIAPWEDLI